MVLDEQLARMMVEMDEAFEDPSIAIGLLAILDYKKRNALMDPLWDEQLQAVRLFLEYRLLFVLKCRQVGMTTVMLALLWLKLYAATDPKYVIAVGHEEGSCKRMASGWRKFGEKLPSFFQPSFSTDNAFNLEFAHNGAGFNSIVAGGRGQGRSNTYSDAMFTEVAFWPTGTAATGKQETSADHDVYQSVEATLHDEEGHIIFESTANGARGLYYDQFKLARQSPEWGFMFNPWYGCSRYQHPFASPDDRLAFEENLSDEDRRKMAEFDISLEQMHWYDRLITVKGFNELRRQREYPWTELDPFHTDNLGWFDSLLLSAFLDMIPPGHDNLPDGHKRFVEYKPGYRHIVACDTAGGVGSDYTAVGAFNDAYVQCSVYHSNTCGPEQTPYEIRSVCTEIFEATGDKPYVIVEANKYGRIVIDALSKMPNKPFILWKDDNQRDFYSQGGRAGDTKKRAYSTARELINGDQVTFNDPVTVRELIDVVELPNGNLAGATGHDDLADMTVLGLYAAESLQFRAPGRVEQERRRARDLRRRARDPFGLRTS